jgi:hypothetical protein
VTEQHILLLACALLTAGTMFYVFNLPASIAHSPEKTRLSYFRERRDAVYENLRDLNFEYKAGKLSDVDYENLRNSLESEAGAILAEIDRLEAAGH